MRFNLFLLNCITFYEIIKGSSRDGLLQYEKEIKYEKSIIYGLLRLYGYE